MKMAGHVYLIGSRLFGWYKIGKSSNASIRISDLGILLPFRIEILAIWKAHNHHEMERLLHEKYALERINGEWFSFTPGQINEMIQGMSTVQVDVDAKFSNLERDTKKSLYQIFSVPRSIEKKIDRLVKAQKQAEQRAYTAEQRAVELEALLKSIELPKI